MTSSYRMTNLFFSLSEAVESTLHVPGLVGVVLFYLLILGVGILAAWKTKTLTSNNKDDYMVAGRNMGLGLGTVTLTGQIDVRAFRIRQHTRICQ